MKTKSVVPALRSNWATSLMKSCGVAVSSLRMVPVPADCARVAFDGLERLTKNVSLGSGVVSPLTCTVTVLVVSPGIKVRSPLVGW